MNGKAISNTIWLKAEQMRKDGASYKKIALSLGISASAVGCHFNPESKEKRKEWRKSHPVPCVIKRLGYTPEK